MYLDGSRLRSPSVGFYPSLEELSQSDITAVHASSLALLGAPPTPHTRGRELGPRLSAVSVWGWFGKHQGDKDNPLPHPGLFYAKWRMPGFAATTEIYQLFPQNYKFCERGAES